VVRSGVYSVDEKSECAEPAVEELMRGFKKEGLGGKIWSAIDGEFERIAKLPKE